MFRFVWCDCEAIVNSEIDNGRGPVDFQVAYSKSDNSLIEFKLAKSPSLKRNLENQLELYKKSSSAQHGIWCIFYYDLRERAKVDGILRKMDYKNNVDVFLIDVSDDKPSASKAS